MQRLGVFEEEAGGSGSWDPVSQGKVVLSQEGGWPDMSCGYVFKRSLRLATMVRHVAGPHFFMF